MIIKTGIAKSLLTVLIIITVNLGQGAAQSADCISDIYTAEINDTSLHYIECGEGEPMVLVHGTLGDYRSWIGQMQALSQNYKVISYSRRYHYPNPWPEDASDFSVNIHAEDLAAFIQSLDLGKVHLVGHSYGAFTSLMVARDYPELVRSLTLGEPPVTPLLNSTSHGESVLQNFLKNAITPSHNAFQNGEIEEGVRLFINGVLGEGAYGNLPTDTHISMLENARELMGEMNGINTKDEDSSPFFTCNEAGQMIMPVLLVEGESSPEMFGLIHDHLERCFQDVDRAFIPDASHDLKIQEPVFGDIVVAHLQNLKMQSK
ncbi:alpha/beta fold hydrolase [Cyclobacterium roseum]|uniref:alpha/beta fold hydrolase n=1 Tax=Cyclobacterium roseum TaxID=2666137 RepID=UPI00139176D5|nr:alpha/beta hydrolase [Cyclobacterium roseum]